MYLELNSRLWSATFFNSHNHAVHLEKYFAIGFFRAGYAAMPWYVFLCATRYTFIAGSYFAQMQDPKLQRENDFSRSDLDLPFGQTGGRIWSLAAVC
jgi:hypothetical protein